MHTNDVEYELDGRRLVGHLAVPDGEDMRPGILVCHEGPGLDDNAKSRADRLADLGYVAFALDYHGDGKPMSDMDAMMTRLRTLIGDPQQTRALGRAGLEVLTSHPRTDTSRLAAIGFCFGGTMSLELARDGADLKAVVGFHSGLATSRPEDATNITGKILVCIGADDPMIPPEQRAAFEDEMRAADVDWRMNLYGGAVHSFTNPRADLLGRPGIAYHGPTDHRSWRAMLDLFDDALA